MIVAIYASAFVSMFAARAMIADAMAQQGREPGID